MTCDPGTYVPAFIALISGVWLYVLVIHKLSNPAEPNGDAAVKCIMFFGSTFRLITGGEVRWLSWLSIFDFEPSQASGGSVCFLPLDPVQKMAFQVLVPFLGLFQLALTALIVWGFRRLQLAIRSKSMEFKLDPFMRTCIALLMFSYTQISTTTFSFLDCMEIGGLNLVRTSPGIDCNSSEYASWLPLVYTCFVYSLLFPWLPWLGLRRFHKRNDIQRMRSKVGNLYETYKPSILRV